MSLMRSPLSSPSLFCMHSLRNIRGGGLRLGGLPSNSFVLYNVKYYILMQLTIYYFYHSYILILLTLFTNEVFIGILLTLLMCFYHLSAFKLLFSYDQMSPWKLLIRKEVHLLQCRIGGSSRLVCQYSLSLLLFCSII